MSLLDHSAALSEDNGVSGVERCSAARVANSWRSAFPSCHNHGRVSASNVFESAFHNTRRQLTVNEQRVTQVQCITRWQRLGQRRQSDGRRGLHLVPTIKRTGVAASIACWFTTVEKPWLRRKTYQWHDRVARDRQAEQPRRIPASIWIPDTNPAGEMERKVK